MFEEKNSLLAYLLDAPKHDQRILCREMDAQRNIHDYRLADWIAHVANFGQYLNDNEAMGQYIPLFMETSYDFLRSFLGVIAGKKVCVPLHTIASDESLEFSFRKIHAKSLVVADPWLYQKLVKIPYVHQYIHTIFCTPAVIAEKALPCDHINLYDIFQQSQDLTKSRQYLQEIVQETRPNDPMQIVFTSGTTGEPKGAILTHSNLVSCVVRAGNHLNITEQYRTLTFLPLSHVMAQNEVFIALVAKAVIQITSRDNLLYALKQFKPNILVSVPRVYQAIHLGIQKKLRNKPLAKKLLNFTVEMYKNTKRSASWIQWILAQLFMFTLGKLITRKIRQNIGKFNLLVTAGAACPSHIYDFFEAIGMPLTNAQGLTEVSGAVIYNSPNETLNGSIGYPLPGVEIRIDEDGEILMKGAPVFSGYLDDPHQNSISITPDGWFRTGDLGELQMINNKPYIFLKGRKKDILVLSSGLNIPAVQIEDRLIQNELIQQAVVLGDGKPKLVALIVPNADHLKNPNLRDEISKIIREMNAQMDASEQIGNFEILAEPFTVENGMLTPTMKIRRMVISQRYEDMIGKMYHTTAC